MGKFILIGAVFGSILSSIMNASLVAGVVLGAIVGAISYSLNTKRSIHPKKTKKDQHIQLKEEQLKITTERVETGEVKVRKEVIEEPRTFTVPIKREEMVIEIGSEDELRIPLKEEEVEISKHVVKVNEVSLSKRQVEDMEHVTETLKKEKIDIKIKGEADVKVDDEKL